MRLGGVHYRMSSSRRRANEDRALIWNQYYSDLRDAISIENLYFTSDLTNLS
jgi:hypothetical protein